MRKQPQKLSAILVKRKKVCPSPLRPAAEGTFERVAQRVRPRRAFFAGGVAAVREHAAQLRLGDDLRVIAHGQLRAPERHRRVEHAARVQQVIHNPLRALAAVDAAHIRRQDFFFHGKRLSFLSLSLSRSECMSTPIELADMAVAQMDGCSTPSAATGMLTRL